jgi:L,D-transpeptidase catalytic domain
VALALGVALAAASSLIAAAPALALARVQAAAVRPVHASLTRLSDLRTLSRWAYPQDEARVRSAPSAHAHAIGRLKFLTSDEQAQLYLALAAEQPASGAAWVRVELPGRPNGRRGWVPRAALGPFHTVRGYLLIDRARLRATLFDHGRAAFSAPVAVGKPGTPTPAGRFYVTEKLRTLNAPAYGPYALGTSAYAPTLAEWPGGGVVGVHGTNEPQLVPGRPSHGCVRMRDADIARLWHVIAVGTPIEIT